MKLIVGLGNPGSEYAGTRHNAGFEVIEVLARRHNISVARRNFKAVLGEGFIGKERVVLARPMTFMNNSGEAVGEICRFYKIPSEDVLLISDDVALPPGRIRLRFRGSAGGHNGLTSVFQHLGTQEVRRIRLGVGAARGNLVGHVLGRHSTEDALTMRDAYEIAADAVEFALSDTFENAMNRYNVTVPQVAPELAAPSKPTAPE